MDYFMRVGMNNTTGINIGHTCSSLAHTKNQPGAAKQEM